MRAVRKDIAPGDSCPLMGNLKPSDLGVQYLNTKPTGRAALPTHPVILVDCAFILTYSVAETHICMLCSRNSQPLSQEVILTLWLTELDDADQEGGLVTLGRN